MNIKNLIMWVIIVLLSVGLFNMFQDPNKINSERNILPFYTLFTYLKYTLRSAETDSVKTPGVTSEICTEIGF